MNVLRSTQWHTAPRTTWRRPSIGKPITAEGKRGCVQGCALSMLFCNVFTLARFQLQGRGTTISDSRIQAFSDFSPHLRKEEDRQSLVFALEAPSTQVNTGGYADDLHLISSLVMQVFRGHVLALLWAAALGMKLNAKKSLAFGTVKLSVGDVELTVVPKCKILGHMLHRGAQLAETPTNRVKEVVAL